MNLKSLKWGIGITLIWLIVIALFWFFGDLKSPSSLNELGDALAGVFAPVAFLWLVLGYIQQGKQLEQNTTALEQQERALQLQIEEMKESVLQQVELKKIEEEKIKFIIRSVKPRLEIIKGYCSLIDTNKNDFYKVHISLKNTGLGVLQKIHIFNLVNEKYLLCCDDNQHFLDEIILNIDSHTNIYFVMKKNEIETLNLRLEYADVYGNVYKITKTAILNMEKDCDNNEIEFI